MNRRLSFNLEDEESAPATIAPPPPVASRTGADPPPPPPPTYINYAPGGRLEFLKDLDAYQAACLISKVDDEPLAYEPSPAYALTDIGTSVAPGPTNDRDIFRTRCEAHLNKLRDFLKDRSRGRLFAKVAFAQKANFMVSTT